MVDAAAESEESFKAAGNVGLDLLWRHSGIKRGHDDHRNVDSWKEIDGYANECRCPYDDDDEAQDDDERRIFDRESRHYCCASPVWPAVSESFGTILSPGRNWPLPLMG